MSNIAMQRQINRLAESIDQIKPRPPVYYKLMGRPRAGASAEVKAAYQAEIDATLAQGFKIIELVGLTKKEPRPWQTRR